MENNTEDLTEQIIFLLLNGLFFAMLIYFIISSSSGAFASEQFYAKQIGMLIDSARPETVLYVDVTDAYNLAKNNNVDLNSIFKIDNDKILVHLSNSRTYAFQFFNDVNVEVTENPYSFLDSGGEKRVLLNLYLRSKDETK
jgi:hypothetical protein